MKKLGALIMKKLGALGEEKLRRIMRLTILTIKVSALLVFSTALCMWLWNALVPEIFGLPAVSYWQATGLMILSSLFFYRPSSSKK